MCFLLFFYIFSKDLKEMSLKYHMKLWQGNAHLFNEDGIRPNLCIICAFFIVFCSKIIFDKKLFSYCWSEFDYPGSIVYFSCFFKIHFQPKIFFICCNIFDYLGPILYLSCYYFKAWVIRDTIC